MKIFLVGLPGSGKSTLGKQLAGKLNFSFIDLDTEIEKSIGLSVKSIFKQYGESFFRKEESEMLHRLGESNESLVIATGGGAPVYFDNMKYMNTRGQTIFLDVPPREIATRIQNSKKEERPLLANLAPDELKDQIEFLRSQRISFYNQAHHRLTGIVQIADLLHVLNVP
jgi:shikimate kinase